MLTKNKQKRTRKCSKNMSETSYILESYVIIKINNTQININILIIINVNRNMENNNNNK